MNVRAFPNLPLVQESIYVDKRFETARAQAALMIGSALYRREADNGEVSYSIGIRRFATLDQVEDFLDRYEFKLNE
jgi:hypothetical protein